MTELLNLENYPEIIEKVEKAHELTRQLHEAYKKLTPQLKQVGKQYGFFPRIYEGGRYYSLYLDYREDDGTNYYKEAYEIWRQQMLDEFADFQAKEMVSMQMVRKDYYYSDGSMQSCVYRHNIIEPIERPDGLTFNDYTANRELVIDYDNWDFNDDSTLVQLIQGMRFLITPIGETPKEEKHAKENDILEWPEWKKILELDTDYRMTTYGGIYTSYEGLEEYIDLCMECGRRILKQFNNLMEVTPHIMAIYRYINEKYQAGSAPFEAFLTENGYSYEPLTQEQINEIREKLSQETSENK